MVSWLQIIQIADCYEVHKIAFSNGATICYIEKVNGAIAAATASSKIIKLWLDKIRNYIIESIVIEALFAHSNKLWFELANK